MAEESGVKLYRQNILDGFPNGCLLDLRVRMAADFLKGGSISGELSPGEAASYSLDLATALLALAEERGLVESLPDDDGLNAQVKKQAGRIARFSAEQQTVGQRAMQETGSGIATPANPFGPRSN